MIQDISRLIADAHENLNYRPVAVAIIKNTNGAILLVRSAKSAQEWYLPQGGINPDEDAKVALFREIQEELGISADELRNLVFVGFEDLDAEIARADKRGFKKGKRYFFFKLHYEGRTAPLTLDISEIDDYVWVHPTAVDAVLVTTRREKRMLMQKFIAKCSQ